jgi:hypothetical protein
MAIVFTSVIYTIMYTPFLQIFLEVGSSLLLLLLPSKAKQSSSSLCVQIFSPLSLLTPFTYYICANSEPITAAGRLKNQVLSSNFLKV